MMIGTREEFLAACGRSAEALTDRDLAILESSHPDIAQQRRDERARALVKKADDDRLRVQQPAAPPSLARQLRREYDPIREEDTVDTWMERNRWMPVPFGDLKTLHDAIWKFLEDSNERNKGRNARLDALTARLDTLDPHAAGASDKGGPQLDSLERRVKALELRPEISYTGVYRDGGTYWSDRSPPFVAGCGSRPGRRPQRRAVMTVGVSSSSLDTLNDPRRGNVLRAWGFAPPNAGA